MSDRFKFRAWHDGRMIYEQFCEYLGSYGCSFAHFDKLKHPLMQSTGLRDKNGKLIFEGDAEVAHEPIDDIYGESAGYLKFIRIVRWSKFSAGFVIDEISEDPNMDKDTYGLDELLEQDGESLCFGIAGNIYETPELLECAE